MPAKQHAASVGIIPTLNRKIAIAAPTESRRAQGSTLKNFGASNAKGKACTGSTSRKIVWMANQIARLRMTPTTAAVIADSDAGAVAALREAAKTTSGLKPISAEARDLFRRPFVAQELKGIDAVVFDPPRQGADSQARQLAASKVPLVIAVSCNVATFVRDARLLADGGYRLTAVTPVDQFRYSAHVELVGRFERQ